MWLRRTLPTLGVAVMLLPGIDQPILVELTYPDRPKQDRT